MSENPAPEHDYLEASPGAKIIVLCFLVFYTLAFLYFKTELEAIGLTEYASQSDIDHSIDRFMHLMNQLLIFTIVQSTLFSVVLIRIANKAMALRQFPPSATMLLKRTKIIRGKIVRGNKAKIAAYGFYLLSVVSWFPVLIPVFLKSSLDNLSAW